MKTVACRGRRDLTREGAAAIHAAVAVGGVILYPTDTVYGLGADPFSEAAVAAVIRLKGRPAGKPLPVLIAGPDLVSRFAAKVPAAALDFALRFWPGPLTLLFAARTGLPPGVRSEAGEVALRVPGSALCRAVLSAAGGCLTGTSANRSGAEAPGAPGAAARALAGRPDLLVDAGTLPPSRVSTLVRVSGGGDVEVIREGAVGAEEIAGARPAGAVDNPGRRVL